MSQWIESEKQVVLHHFESLPKKEVMQMLPNRTWSAIKTFANTFGKIRKYKSLTKSCNRCGTAYPREEFRFKKSESCYCKSCDIKWKTERKRILKRRAVEYKGGKCVVCGYAGKSLRAMTFHHIDPATKDSGLQYKVSSGGVRMVPSLVGQGWGWEKIKQEIDKCELVCIRCHMEIEDGIINLKEVVCQKS